VVDGQHRLWAVVKSRKPIRFTVVEGVTDSMMRAVDTGKHRSYMDHLSIHRDLSYVACVAAVVRLLWMEERGKDPTAKGGHSKPTYAELDAVQKKHPDLPEFAAECLVKGLLAPHSLVTYCYYKFWNIDPDLAETWREQFVDGVNVEKDTPVYYLRQRLIRNLNSVVRLPSQVVFALMIKSWNAMRKNQSFKNARWTTEEKFPTPV
jgi:hypothetical protein